MHNFTYQAQSKIVELKKVCLQVTAEFRKEGGVKPLSFTWEDGRIFTVERITAVERAPARVEALMPLRFTCFIAGKERFLYFEPKKMRWFVEIQSFA